MQVRNGFGARRAKPTSAAISSSSEFVSIEGSARASRPPSSELMSTACGSPQVL